MINQQNCLNLSEKNLDEKIYRIFSIQRFLELMTTKRNTLVRPALWDDPFENFILNSKIKTSSGIEVTASFKDDLYGQCWTYERDSDAMWRIYSPDKFGIRVRTTIIKLFSSFENIGGNHPELSCFIGKVEYTTQKRIVRLLEDAGSFNSGILDQSGKDQVRTLLFKREEFKHEEEVRLVYFNHDKQYDSNIFQYSFDPFEVITEVAFDPRLSKEMVNVFSDHIYSLGFKKNQVRQSPLYKLPKLTAHVKDTYS